MLLAQISQCGKEYSFSNDEAFDPSSSQKKALEVCDSVAKFMTSSKGRYFAKQGDYDNASIQFTLV